MGEPILLKQLILRKEMKMMEYITPEMEVVEMKYAKMLCASEDSGTDPNSEWDPNPGQSDD